MLDVAALYEPGEDRGLGRYARTLRDASHRLLEYEVFEYEGKRGGAHHRFNDWLGIFPRRRAIARRGPHFHATGVYHLDPAHLSSTVVSIQDLIPLEVSAYRQTGIKAATFFRWAARCPVVITSSYYTAGRARDLLGFSGDQIVVSPLPVPEHEPYSGACSCSQLPSRNDRYVVSVIDCETPDPRKRAPWIFGAAQHLAEHDLPVVLVGRGTDAVRQENVRGYGRLCDHHLRQVLGGADCFLYASAYEGQGLPPQEALREGTPAVAFRNTSIEQMVGSGAEWIDERPGAWERLFETSAQDPEAKLLATRALRLHNDEERRLALAARGREHVKGFTMERFVDRLRTAYQMLWAATASTGSVDLTGPRSSVHLL